MLGILETRILDFKNLIITSVNEGVLPKSKSKITLIPNDIRKAFSLQLGSNSEEIISLHFYRLIDNALNVKLLCNTKSNQLGGGEPSRLIHQLELVLAKQLQLKIRNSSFSIPLNTQGGMTELSYVQSAESLDILRTYITERGISPSFISSFLRCPYTFYQNYVLGYRVQEEIGEEPDFKEIGTIVHNVLEHVYVPLIGKRGILKDLETAIANLDQLLEVEYKKIVRIKHVKGSHSILFGICKNLIKSVIDFDIKTCKSEVLEIVAIEKNELEKEEPKILKLENGEVLRMKVNCKIDRVDYFPAKNQLRIIDYKTGKVEDKDMKFKAFNLTNILEMDAMDKQIQLLFYAWVNDLMFANSHPNTPFKTGLLPLRAKKDELDILYLKLEDKSELSFPNADIMEEFEAFLIKFFSVLLSKETIFTQKVSPELAYFVPN